MRTKNIDYWIFSNSLYLRLQLYMEARVKICGMYVTTFRIKCLNSELRIYLTSVHFDPFRYYMSIISKLSEKMEYLYEMRTKNIDYRIFSDSLYLLIDPTSDTLSTRWIRLFQFLQSHELNPLDSCARHLSSSLHDRIILCLLS